MKVLAGTAGLVLLLSAGGTLYALSSGDDEGARPVAPRSSVKPQPVNAALGAEALLQPEDAFAITGRTWEQDGGATTPSPDLMVCSTPSATGLAANSRALQRALASVTSQVIKYGDNGAQAVLSGLRGDVRRCPSRPLNPAPNELRDDFALLASPAPDVVVVQDSYRDCDSCAGSAPRIWVVLGSGDFVSYTSVPASETHRLAAWTDATRARLTCATGRCTTATVDHGAAFPHDVVPTQGQHVVGVYLAVVREPRTRIGQSALDEATQQASLYNYTVTTGDLACDQGAAATLRLDPRTAYTGAALYFATVAEAQQFVVGYRPAVVGTASVETFCRD